MPDLREASLAGLIDLHLHAGPDVRPRRHDDVDLARAAARAGYRAILLKSHHTLTADRAQIAAKVVGGAVKVFGGVALNRAVGGINPDAVDAALRMGAKQVWMPTISATVEAPHRPERRPPVLVLDDSGDLRPEVREVLEQIRDADVILGTGHLTGDELAQVIGAAIDMGLKKVLLTHPEHPLIDLPTDVQQAYAARGVMFERCFCFSLGAVPGRRPSLGEMAAAIRTVGARSTVLSTDLGRADLPDPIEGLTAYLQGLANEGLSPSDLRLMACDNPARLLDL